MCLQWNSHECGSAARKHYATPVFYSLDGQSCLLLYAAAFKLMGGLYPQAGGTLWKTPLSAGNVCLLLESLACVVIAIFHLSYIFTITGLKPNLPSALSEKKKVTAVL